MNARTPSTHTHAHIQLLLHNKLKSNCKYDYPQEVQPNIDQSQDLGIDKQGRTLPGPFANLLASGGGRLPYEVPLAAQEDEKATLWWLFDKTTQLTLYAPCSGGGSVPFASLNQMAPGFTQGIVLYDVNEYNETLPSNFTHAAGLVGQWARSRQEQDHRHCSPWDHEPERVDGRLYGACACMCGLGR